MALYSLALGLVSASFSLWLAQTFAISAFAKITSLPIFLSVCSNCACVSFSCKIMLVALYPLVIFLILLILFSICGLVVIVSGKVFTNSSIISLFAVIALTVFPAFFDIFATSKPSASASNLFASTKSLAAKSTALLFFSSSSLVIIFCFSAFTLSLSPLPIPAVK